jgi:malate dehydrogenase (oxaloacetate-decarboxylating)(NADP+)
MVRNLVEKAQRKPKRVVFAEAENYNVLKAAQISKEEGMAIPILLGRVDHIRKMMDEYGIEMNGVEIIDPRSPEEQERRETFGEQLYIKRQRKGMTENFATKLMGERNYFGNMLVETGAADAMLSGITQKYADVVKPALKVIGKKDDVRGVAGMYIVMTKNGPMFLADTTMHQNPTAEEVEDITLSVAKTIRKMGLTPRIAMLSYSNFGSGSGEDAEKMAKATKALHEKHPNLIVDGEIQANFALNNELMKEKFPFSQLLNKKVNTLIFPNLAAGNIAYKLLVEMTDAEAIGPILIGMKKSVHVLNLGSSVRDIVNMVAVAVLDAQSNK